MGWTTPRTWRPNEMNGAGWMNSQIRDNFTLLKTNMDDLGGLKTALKTFGYVAGVSSAAGEDEMGEYAVDVPAGFLSHPGEALVLEGAFTTSATAGTKVMKFSLDAVPTKATVLSVATVSTIWAFQLEIVYRTNTTAEVSGWFWGAASTTGVLTVMYVTNVGMTTTWSVAQILRLWTNTVAVGEIKMYEYLVNSARSITGTLV